LRLAAEGCALCELVRRDLALVRCRSAEASLFAGVQVQAVGGRSFARMSSTLAPLHPPPGAPPSPPSPGSTSPLIPLFSNLLLFCLVTALASSVDIAIMTRRSSTILRGVAVAMCCQFVLLPFAGFCAVRGFGLERIDGIMLMVVVSSPGGAYSNWWCSLSNADLALSVASTACSTVLSAALLPLNMLLYLSASYGASLLMPSPSPSPAQPASTYAPTSPSHRSSSSSSALTSPEPR
jgi:hypothetical protein